MDKYGANQPLAFPNTAYYLPVIYSILGTKIEKLRMWSRCSSAARNCCLPI